MPVTILGVSDILVNKDTNFLDFDPLMGNDRQ